MPDAATNQVSLGDFQPAETKTVQVVLSCLAASGCPSTTFSLSLWTNQGTQQVLGSEVRVTAEFLTTGR